MSHTATLLHRQQLTHLIGQFLFMRQSCNVRHAQTAQLHTRTAVARQNCRCHVRKWLRYWHDGHFSYISHGGHDCRASSTRPLRYVNIRLFLSVMPPKDLAPFSYISPQKNPRSAIKYELISHSCQQTGKKTANGKRLAHPRTPQPRLRKICFIVAIQPFCGCQRNSRKEYNNYCVG